MPQYGLANAIDRTSNNSKSVTTLGEVSNPIYDPGQIRALINKVDEMINELRR